MLSVVVPAYREGDRIAVGIGKLTDALRPLEVPYEVIVVCDGDVGGTFEHAQAIEDPQVRVYGYSPNMGKGYALRYGFERSQGELVTFIDADMELHPKEIGIFIKLMDIYDCDVVVGSKRHPQSRVNYPAVRRLQSWVYQMLVRLLFNLDVSDTQTGLKLFRRPVLEKVLPRVGTRKFAFDLELFVIAHEEGFRSFIEAPVAVDYQFSTSTNLKAALDVLLDTFKIFMRLHRGSRYGAGEAVPLADVIELRPVDVPEVEVG